MDLKQKLQLLEVYIRWLLDHGRISGQLYARLFQELPGIVPKLEEQLRENWDSSRMGVVFWDGDGG